MQSAKLAGVLAIFILHAPAVVAGSELGLPEVLAGDDECTSAENENCAVNALQRRALTQGSNEEDDGAEIQEVPDSEFEDAVDELAGRSDDLAMVEAGGTSGYRRRYHRFCAESCWVNYGFGPGDCKCSIHGTWYMWICWKRAGKLIPTEYGKQYTCSGLSKPAAPAPVVPAPVVPVPHPVAKPAATCTVKYTASCAGTRTCCDAGYTCYEKNSRWAGCLRSCTPGINIHEPIGHRTPWSCKVLTKTTTTTTTTTRPSSPYHPEYRPLNPKLAHPSNASLMTFHLFRVRSDENYSCCVNADMTTAGAAMFYLHNEIVWHATSRSGTFFSTPKTRIVRYKVQTRATQPLHELGMDFGVMNEFDITQCTGPFECSNFQTYGYTVGCENWIAGSPANFPHQKWNTLNKYPKAMWFSLPGPCPMKKLGQKTEACTASHPGGQCPPGVTPTGTGDCTYSLEESGEISIDEMEGITSYADFIKEGGREYDRITDQGIHMNFWDGRFDEKLCEQRTKKLEQMFDEKYPDDPTIEPPECNFNKWKFFPGRTV